MCFQRLAGAVVVVSSARVGAAEDAAEGGVRADPEAGWGQVQNLGANAAGAHWVPAEGYASSWVKRANARARYADWRATGVAAVGVVGPAFVTSNVDSCVANGNAVE